MLAALPPQDSTTQRDMVTASARRSHRYRQYRPVSVTRGETSTGTLSVCSAGSKRRRRHPYPRTGAAGAGWSSSAVVDVRAAALCGNRMRGASNHAILAG